MRIRDGLLLFVCFLGLALLSACATKIDWNSRIGLYTYDQALTEMGPPDKSAQLSDGSTVAEWLAYRSSGFSNVQMVGAYPYRRRGYFYAPSYVVTTEPGYERFLRLTFDPEGRLTAWKNVTK